MKLHKRINAYALNRSSREKILSSNARYTQCLLRILLFSLLLPAIQVSAQPGPGDVFREYTWLPDMVAEQGKFLRVGGRLDYKISEDHFPADKHLNGYISLLEDIDIKGAIRAEMMVEKLGSHENTNNLRVSFNHHQSIIFPTAKGIPEPESDYMYHNYPVVEIPLDQIKQGDGNVFRFDVDSVQRWNWPQNIIYGVILRIYYPPGKAEFTPDVVGVADGDMLESEQKLGLSHRNASISSVEYVGYYEDINWEGDGIYKQWHYHFFRGKVVHNIGNASMYPFEVIWNTTWLPDQEKIKIAARVKSNSGIIYFTQPIENLALDRNFSVELCKPYGQPKNWVTREGECIAKFDVHTDQEKIKEAKAYWVSWSPCYANGVFINDHQIFDRNDLCYEYMAHEVDIPDPTILKKGTNVIRTAKEPLHNGQMVHGMEVQWPGIMVKVRTAKTPVSKITPEEYEGRTHFKIETPKITYYYDIRGGGFSRIIDSEGNDWVSFRMNPWDEYPGSAAGAFRGLPNMVFQDEDGGAGHPGHDKCTSWIEENNVLTESASGNWKWSWEFFTDHAVLEMLRTDTTRAYWFLWEGTPGGTFDPQNTWFGTNLSGPQKLVYDYYDGNIYKESFSWIYTGTKHSNNTFYIVQVTPDDSPDMASMLGNTEKRFDSTDGMTVIGLGRGEGVNRFLRGRNKFVIGMYPMPVKDKTDHRDFAEFIELNYLNEPSSLSKDYSGVKTKGHH